MLANNRFGLLGLPARRDAVLILPFRSNQTGAALLAAINWSPEGTIVEQLVAFGLQTSVIPSWHSLSSDKLAVGVRRFPFLESLPGKPKGPPAFWGFPDLDTCSCAWIGIILWYYRILPPFHEWCKSQILFCVEGPL